jgi:predicted ABC-class ATPase
MQNTETIKMKLKGINAKDYGAYQALIGEYDYSRFRLIIDQIPKDPYAPPHTGIYRVRIRNEFVDNQSGNLNSETKRVAFRDFLARNFFNEAMKISKGRRGTGYSGIITIDEPGQTILERSSVITDNECIEVRFFLGLPASGRMINSLVAEGMLLKELPEIVERSLYKENIDMEYLRQHIETTEDAEFLRTQLESLGLVSFIANDSILPRKSGTSDKPLDREVAILFHAPESLEVEIELPHAGKIKGMGIAEGITLITGGGFHGKSTLLHSVESGIYNHISGDGREKCVSNPNTLKIRSYSGRYVENVDISTFIKNLPLQKNTCSFSTENASGSTSQAASILEAIEMDAKVLLMDEDTCATNFMIRDQKMQKLVQKGDEPITTFIDKAKQLFSERDVSTILVLGGAGDYFDIADTVIQMITYVPYDVTDKAHEISKTSQAKRISEDEGYPIIPKERIPIPESINPYNDYNKLSIYSKEVNRLNFGKTIIDLTDVEQLIELSQTKAIGQAILYLKKYMDGKTSLKEIINILMLEIERKGLDVISPKISGHFARFRDLELAFAINRLRGLKMVQSK